MTRSRPGYKRHRFPPEIIAHAVWLYYRFNLGFCEVEEVSLERRIDISYATFHTQQSVGWLKNSGPLLQVDCAA